MRNIPVLAAALMAVLLSLAHPAYSQTTMYFHVSDCETGGPVAGATVVLERDRFTTSSATNATGYAEFRVEEGAYKYYIYASGYRLKAGEIVVTSGAVFRTCLFKTTAGFWRVVADITEWRGDIHAGGLGWAMIRLKNLEDGTFYIQRIEVLVEGYDKPVAYLELREPAVLGRVEKTFNVTVAPPPDAPVGRLKAGLRMKAEFEYADRRRIGPLTVDLDLDRVLIQPYRTFTLNIYDKFGMNPVPGARVVLTSTLTGSSFMYVADEGGVISVSRISDAAYLFEVFYNSPYDEQAYRVYQRFEVLVDVVRGGAIYTSLYDAHVLVKDLSGRRLNTTVALGRILKNSVDGVAVFNNVPRGVYGVRVWWRGVESFNGTINVDDPLIIKSPGGVLEATAKVGDIVIQPRDWEGKKLSMFFTARIGRLNLTASGVEALAFIQLPPGAYDVAVFAYNSLLGRDVEVGRASFTIPKDHGDHTVRLDVYDVVFRLVTSDGKPAPVEEFNLSGLNLRLAGGSVKVYNLTVGDYSVKASYMGVPVLDRVVSVEGPEAVVETDIYPLRLTLKTVDGEPLEEGAAAVKVGSKEVAAPVKEGVADVGHLPRGSYSLKITLSGEEVYSGNIDVVGENPSLAVRAGRPSVKVVDQKGKPLQAEVEVAGLAKSSAGPDGVARFRQAPLRDYPYRVSYMGVEVASGTLRPGQQAEVVVKTVTLTVKVFNELNAPMDVEVTLSRAGRLIGRSTSSTAVFREIPAGAYSLVATYGPKQVSKQLNLQADHELVVTMPVAFSIGPIYLSLQEVMLPASLVIGAMAVVAVLRLVPRFLRRG
jgi:hypothetical protein